MFQNAFGARRTCSGTVGIVYASVSKCNFATEASCTQKSSAKPLIKFVYVTLKKTRPQISERSKRKR